MATPEHLRFVATITAAPAGGGANPALVDFDFDMSSSLTVPELGARIIGYLGGYGASYGAGTFALAGISWRLASVAGSIALPFPDTEYAALRDTWAGLPSLEDYGETVGTGALTPIGTSVLVREITANPTRRGKGRHYLPFIGSDFITATGELDAAAAAGIASNFGAMFLGQVVGGISSTPAHVCVVSNADEAVRRVTGVSVSTTCSNLRTRRR